MIGIKSLRHQLPLPFKNENYNYFSFCEHLQIITLYNKSKNSLLILQKGNEIRELFIKNWQPKRLVGSKDFILFIGNMKSTSYKYKLYCLQRKTWIKEFTYKQNIEDLFW